MDLIPEREKPSNSEFQVIFSEKVTTLPPEEAKKLAQEYIDRFSGKPVDDSLIREAGINKQNTDPRHITLTKRSGGNIILAELETRMNYCQYILQQKSDTAIPPYTQLRLCAKMNPATVAEITLSEGETIKVVQEPFNAFNRENQVRQYQAEDKAKIIGATQLTNQAASILGTKYQIPDSQVVGVLYFSNPTK